MSCSKSIKHDREILSLASRAMTCLLDNYAVIFRGREERLDLLPKELRKDLFIRRIRQGDLEVPLLARVVDKNTTTMDLRCVWGLDNTGAGILQGFTGLSTLFLHAVAADSRALCAMFSPMARLTMLEMRDCPSFDDDVVTTVAESCPCLKVFNASRSGISDVGMEALARNWIALLALDISFTMVTSAGIRALASGPSRGSLRELKARGSGIGTSPQIISSISLFPMLDDIDFDLGPQDDGNLVLSRITKRLKNISFTVPF